MDKYIFYPIILIVLFCSCSSKNKDIDTIKASVEDVERILNRFDKNVQSAIDSKNFEYIKLVSRNAMDSTNIKLNELKDANISSSQNDLKDAATAYILALQKIILIEEMYSSITESISIDKANSLDMQLIKASEDARKEYVKYTNVMNEPLSN